MSDQELPALSAAFTLYSGYADSANLLIAIGLALVFGVMFWFAERMSPTEKGLLLLGGTMVLAGVAGEYFFADKVVTTAAELQRRSDEKIARAEAAFGAAQAKLESLTAPRALTAQQQSEIVDKVRAFAGQRYTIGVIFDPEADEFRVILSQVLDDAGWVRMPPLGEVTTPDGQASIAFKGGGVRIQIAPSKVEELRPRAEVLADLLRKRGIASKTYMNPELDGGGASSIHIIVGAKSE